MRIWFSKIQAFNFFLVAFFFFFPVFYELACQNISENRPVARGVRGCDAPPKSAKRSTFSHKVGQKWGFCRRVKGGEVQKVHFLGSKGPLFWGPVPPPPPKKKIDPGYGPGWKDMTDTIKHFEQQTSSTLCSVFYLVHPKIKFHISYWTKLGPIQIRNVCWSEKIKQQKTTTTTTTTKNMFKKNAFRSGFQSVTSFET